MKIKWRNILGYGFGLAVLAIILYLGGVRAVELAVTPHLGFLFMCLFANLAVYAVSSFRWGFITNTIFGRKITTYPRYFSYFVSSRFFGQYISQAGGDFMVKPGLLKQIDGIPLKSGLYAAVIEKLFDLSLIGILLTPSLLFLFEIINENFSVAIGLVTAIIFLTFLLFQTANLIILLTRAFNFVVVTIQKVPVIGRYVRGQRSSQVEHLEKLNILEKKTIFYVFILTIIRFSLLVTRLLLLNASLGLGIPASLFIVGIPIAQLALVLAITPGALGILEGGWYAILSLGGIPAIERSAFLIGQRVYWSLFIAIISLLTYIVFGIAHLGRESLPDNER
jgi:uncharacterized protein (TIRG00374 family)